MTRSQNRTVSILVVDDDEIDFYMVKRAFSKLALATQLVSLCDGQELLDYLLQEKDYTVQEQEDEAFVILLDINMPRMNGLEALQNIRQHPKLCSLPIVMFSTSSLNTDIEKAYQFGANAYICKPKSFDEMIDIAKLIDVYWCELVRLPLLARL